LTSSTKHFFGFLQELENHLRIGKDPPGLGKPVKAQRRFPTENGGFSLS
jgi:hypothetical protein